MYTKPFIYGLLSSLALISIYFGILTLISGFGYALTQFSQYWYFIVGLAIGFGIQIGLYTYVRNTIHASRGGSVLKVTGATSTTAMLSCCTHYLVNLLPVLGAAGLVTFIAQYQVELFWVGIVFNLGGIAYISSIIYKLKHHEGAY